MKIGGAGGPKTGPASAPESAARPGASESPERGSRPNELDSRSFSQLVDAPAAVQTAAPAAATSRSALSRIVSDLRLQIEGGKLEPSRAVDTLVQEIVSQRGKHLADSQRQQLHQSLLRLLQEDPALAGFMRELGG